MTKRDPGSERDPIDIVREALAGLRFGEIVVVVHDGEIVQIARTEKLRPRDPPRTSPRAR